MKIAVCSDGRLPTSRAFPGHGLGKVALEVAEGLQALGHSVSLIAASGSEATVSQIATCNDETKMWELVGQVDAIVDFTHQKDVAKKHVAPTLCAVQDREYPARGFGIYPTQAHLAWHQQNFGTRGGRVIHNGVDVKPIERWDGGYYAYLSMMHAPKQPKAAWQAAKIAGVRLVMAGPTPPDFPGGAEYIGPVSGADKWHFLAGAKALVFPASTEAGAVTVLEALSVGTPVIVSCFGGARENCDQNKNGLVVGNVDEFAWAIGQIESGAFNPSADDCTLFVLKDRSVDVMVSKYEQAITDMLGGAIW